MFGIQKWVQKLYGPFALWSGRDGEAYRVRVVPSNRYDIPIEDVDITVDVSAIDPDTRTGTVEGGDEKLRKARADADLSDIREILIERAIEDIQEQVDLSEVEIRRAAESEGPYQTRIGELSVELDNVVIESEGNEDDDRPAGIPVKHGYSLDYRLDYEMFRPRWEVGVHVEYDDGERVMTDDWTGDAVHCDEPEPVIERDASDNIATVRWSAPIPKSRRFDGFEAPGDAPEAEAAEEEGEE